MKVPLGFLKRSPATSPTANRKTASPVLPASVHRHHHEVALFLMAHFLRWTNPLNCAKTKSETISETVRHNSGEVLIRRPL